MVICTLGVGLKHFVFACCTAAISSVFDLKNASLDFLSLHGWWLTLQHALQKSSPALSIQRERGRRKNEGRILSCGSNTHTDGVPAQLFMCPQYLLCVCLQMHLISIPCGFLWGGSLNWGGSLSFLYTRVHFEFIWAPFCIFWILRCVLFFKKK